MDGIAAYEEELLDYGTNALREVPGLRIIGEANHKASVLSFVLDGIHPHDIGTILDQEGIAVRTGPGHTALTRIPCSAHSTASCWVRLMTAALLGL